MLSFRLVSRLSRFLIQEFYTTGLSFSRMPPELGYDEPECWNFRYLRNHFPVMWTCTAVTIYRKWINTKPQSQVIEHKSKMLRWYYQMVLQMHVSAINIHDSLLFVCKFHVSAFRIWSSGLSGAGRVCGAKVTSGASSEFWGRDEMGSSKISSC